ncbi:unnamed protein product [Closterium sp. NIES-65]|nr:unnamed protein product [Closterium sp. NIES-65]
MPGRSSSSATGRTPIGHTRSNSQSLPMTRGHVSPGGRGGDAAGAAMVVTPPPGTSPAGRSRWRNIIGRPLESLAARFELTGEVLGKGYFGDVVVCVERDSGEHFACKVINKANVKVSTGGLAAVQWDPSSPSPSPDAEDVQNEVAAGGAERATFPGWSGLLYHHHVLPLARFSPSPSSPLTPPCQTPEDAEDVQSEMLALEALIEPLSLAGLTPEDAEDVQSEVAALEALRGWFDSRGRRGRADEVAALEALRGHRHIVQLIETMEEPEVGGWVGLLITIWALEALRGHWHIVQLIETAEERSQRLVSLLVTSMTMLCAYNECVTVCWEEGWALEALRGHRHIVQLIVTVEEPEVSEVACNEYNTAVCRLGESAEGLPAHRAADSDSGGARGPEHRAADSDSGGAGNRGAAAVPCQSNGVIHRDVKLHTVYLVMELCQGGTLQQAVREQGPFNEPQAAAVVAAAAEALLQCHSNGIIHRDVKPDNILLGERLDVSGGGLPGDVKICDFGISTFFQPGTSCTEILGTASFLLSSLSLPQIAPLHSFAPLCTHYQPNTGTTCSTSCSEIVGTASFLSPEMLAQTYSCPTDIWSLGVLLHLLLSGFLPFCAPTKEADFEAIPPFCTPFHPFVLHRFAPL